MLLTNLLILAVAYAGARGLRNGLILGALGLFFLFWIGILFVFSDNAPMVFKISFGIGIALSFMTGKHIPERYLHYIRSRAARSINCNFPEYIESQGQRLDYQLKATPYTVTTSSIQFHESLCDVSNETKERVHRYIRETGAKQRSGQAALIAGLVLALCIFFGMDIYLNSPLPKPIKLPEELFGTFQYYAVLFVLSALPTVGLVHLESWLLVKSHDINQQYIQFEYTLNKHCETLLQDEVAQKQAILVEQAAREKREAHERRMEVERERTRQAEIAVKQKQYELDKKRPAKTQALSDIFDKLDEI